ncbi:GerMN domain-containing protein [Paenibacillus harenae]|uniref:GerMN domain-containing protein n=1 Tax=Paenibacillus harenae TaxID=306543 RepID=UPI002791FDBE|nr:GerMN domain-containing protein [Paenibacillus harenae]MDQ0061228.1 germination protein M [Paenibacillus harenae]
MVQKGWIRRTALTGVLVLPILTAGCGLFSQETGKSIDPPQVEDTTNGTDNEQTGQADPQGQGTHMTVYLQDRNGYLAPVSFDTTLGANEAAGQRALEMMVEGGAYASLLPEEFRALIPQGTQIKSFSVDKENKLALVDFSEPFASYNAQDERAIVEAITWTLTAIPGIENVQLSLEGEKLSEMPEDAFPLDLALNRDIGINIEAADGVNYMQSTPVTLYFSAKTLSEDQYYVPVTRLIATDKPTAEAAMEELIAGPLDKKELTSIILPDVKVKSIETNEDVVTVDLEDETYEAGQQMPSEMLEAVVLSITENTGAASVQILINGEANVVDDEDKSYTAPVSRPNYVNALKS